MRNNPYLKLFFGLLITLGSTTALMYILFLPLWLISGQTLDFTEFYGSGFPGEFVRPRNILEINNAELLWHEKINIDDPGQSWVDLYITGEKTLAFWSHKSESLISRDLLTGDVIWETQVPYVTELRFYQGNFYISSYKWLDRFSRAPTNSETLSQSCSFGGEALVLAVDATTGLTIWGYTYWGADSNGMSISDQKIYLSGGADHGARVAIVQVDSTTGSLLDRDCFKVPDEIDLSAPSYRHLTVPRNDEGIPSSPNVVVLPEHGEEQLSLRNVSLFFVAEEGRLDILDGQSKEIISSVSFDGRPLNPWDIDVAVQGNVAVIYFGDSHQLFGFRLPDLIKD